MAITIPATGSVTGYTNKYVKGTAMASTPYHPKQWEESKRDLCARIARTTGVLKIVLKTKDDPYLLERWIDHHARIVGVENLIIFDNMSTDDEVRAIYDTYRTDVLIIRFGGFHNSLHDVSAFPELYACLRESTRFYTFIDTDEYLTLINDDRYYSDESIPAFLRGYDDTGIIPATWIYNIPGSTSMYACGTDGHILSQGLKWGKPVLNSAINIAGYINHNSQIDSGLYTGRIPNNIFLRHIANYSPRQRLAANRNKLVARKYVSADADIDSIGAMDISDMADYSIKHYVTEIRDLLKLDAKGFSPPGSLSSGQINLATNGNIEYFSDVEKTLLGNFLVPGNSYVRRILGEDKERVQGS